MRPTSREELMRVAYDDKNFTLTVFQDFEAISKFLYADNIEFIRLVGPHSIAHIGDGEENTETPIRLLVVTSIEMLQCDIESLKKNIEMAHKRFWGEDWLEIRVMPQNEFLDRIDVRCTCPDKKTWDETYFEWAETLAICLYSKYDKTCLPDWIDIRRYFNSRKENYILDTSYYKQ